MIHELPILPGTCSEDWADAYEPFPLCDTITITDAAMVYTDRHPRPGFLWGRAGSPYALNPNDPDKLPPIETLVGRWAGAEPPIRRRFVDDPDDLPLDAINAEEKDAWEKEHISWSVYRTLMDRLATGTLQPVKAAYYTTNYEINPVLTTIALSALLALAQERGDASPVIQSLLTRDDDLIRGEPPDGVTPNPEAGKALAGKGTRATPTTGRQARPDGDDDTRPAPDTVIHEALTAVYDAAEDDGDKPPNVNEGIKPVQAWLLAKGYTATGLRILKVADDQRHKKRRLGVGKHRGHSKSGALTPQL